MPSIAAAGSLRFVCQDQWRNRGHIQKPRVFEPGAAQPLAHFSERQISPASVLTSMLTAKMRALGGPERSALGMNSWPSALAAGKLSGKSDSTNLAKKRRALFAIHFGRRASRADDLGQLQPTRKQLPADVRKEHSVIRRLGRNQKRGAFRRQAEPPLVARQQLNADQNINQPVDAAQRGAGFRGDLRRSQRAFVKKIKNPVPHRRLDNKRRRISPGKLHDAIRRERFLFHTCARLVRHIYWPSSEAAYRRVNQIDLSKLRASKRNGLEHFGHRAGGGSCQGAAMSARLEVRGSGFKV